MTTKQTTAPLIDGAWYWVHYSGLFQATAAPAQYKAEANAFYSVPFAGIPRDEVEILAALTPPAAVGTQPAGNEQKALAALRYYNDECTGQEPSLSVFQQMADEALSAARRTEPMAWMNTYTLEAMRKAPATEKSRWPVHRLTKWDDKTDFTPLYTAPQAQPADALDAETIKKAARYDWLRDENAYAPEEALITGGEELDELCDAGIAEKKGGAA